jgi:dihydrodipicolinate synthase/N-acetylneuraminate lyase
MSIILKGVMQSTVTPLKDDFSLDLPTFERLLDFHVRTGATAISWPHHKGESLNLTMAERKIFAEAAVKVTAGRIPVSIHVSALAVEDSLALARHAQQIGADAIIAITPYFWRPSAEAVG